MANIYETTLYDKSKMQNLVNDRRKLANDPTNTNIIPQFFNNLFQDNKQTELVNPHYANNDYKHTVLMDFADKLTDDNFKSTFDFSTSIKSNDNKKNEFFGQFEKQTLHSNTPIPKNDIGNSSRTQFNNLQRDIELKGNFSVFDNNDMTYGIISKDKFIHNNMVPFTDGKGLEHTKQNANNRNFLVELFTGSSVNHIPKKETPRFFLPEKDITYGSTMGMPNQSDFLQSRYYVSDTRQGEKPFESVKVTPGLGLNYYEEAKFGFHDPYRVVPKSVDELRAANDPKISYKTVIIPGKKGEVRGVQAPVNKNRTEKFKEYNTNDMVPVGGEHKGPYAKEKYVLNDNARMTKKALVGTPFNAGNSKHYVYEKDTFTSQRKELGPENPTGTKGMYDHAPAYPMPTTFQMYEQERETTNEFRVGGVASSELHAPTTHLQDKVRDTTKQTTINNQYHGGLGTGQTHAPTAYFTDKAKQTTKQTTINNKYLNGVTQVYQKPSSHLQDKAKSTIKQTTINNQYNGPIGQSQLHAPTSHLQDTAKSTIKQTTINNQYNGPIGQSQLQAPTSHLQDKAKSTIKQTTIDDNRIGAIGTSELHAPTSQFQDKAKNTIKQTTIDDNRSGPAGESSIHAPTAYFQDLAKNTIKQTTIDDNRVGPVGESSIHAPTSYFQDIARNTIKQTTIDNNYSGPAGTPELNAPTSQMAEHNMFIDDRRQIANVLKAPTNVGSFETPGKYLINLTKFNNPLLYARFNTPYTEQVGKLGFIGTKDKQHLLNIETERINPYVLSSVASNPLVNNVVIQKDYNQCNERNNVQNNDVYFNANDIKITSLE